MTEFHTEYQRVFGDKASLCTIIKKRMVYMNPPIPSSVCKEEMQDANVDTDEVIIEYIMDAHGNKVKKLKPLFIKSEPNRTYVQHIPSDNELPIVPESNFTQKQEITVESYSEPISSDEEASDDRTITADSDSSEALDFEDTPCKLETSATEIEATLNQIATGLQSAGNGYLALASHMVLSEKSRPKSAFVSAYGKWEFKRCPFGLAQAPAYFQRLVNKVLSGLTFAFGYLDDILIFSPDMETHLKHLRILFKRLRSADLKLKEVKCNFLKKHIQYLGHMISGEGISPVPEKLESIQKMLPPRNPKQVKQFLGLIGYYRKFVPQFSDLARPLNALTQKDTVFEWTQICQESFDLLKACLMTEPILTYPDPNLPYVLFTDASKYAWACVLTQEKTHLVEGKEIKILHPITYMSGLFRGSQMNWACLTKEAYAIYMSIKKLAYYLEDADITLQSDHLPLKKFLAKNTLNSKVNNWAIEILPFHITFEYIKGIKITLADTMSHLINIDPQIQLEPEPEGHEFGYYTFNSLPALEL